MAQDNAAIATQEAAGLFSQARTVTGDNIAGTAKISAHRAFNKAIDQYGARRRRSSARRCDRKEYEDRRNHRTAQLDHQNSKEIVDDLNAQAGLEKALASDGALRAAFLEQEVAGCKPVDRYEIGFEIVTAIEIPALVTTSPRLKSSLPCLALAARLQIIIDQLEGKLPWRDADRRQRSPRRQCLRSAGSR